MSSRTPVTLHPETPVDRELRVFTYRDLLEMERTGIIGEDERIELLGGRVYRMTIKPPHAWAVSALTQKLSVAFDGRAMVATQQPLRLSDDMNDTELPQPDVMLLQERSYLDHPGPHHVLLLVEVSDSTLRKDTAIKLPLYARAGVPDPAGSDYRYRAFHDLTATLAPRAFADRPRRWLPDTLHALLDRHDPNDPDPAFAPE